MKDLQDPQAPQGLQGREALQVLLGPLAFPGDPGPRDLQDQLERKVHRVRKVRKALLAETVCRVLWGSLVQLARWAPQEKMETRERSGSQDRRGAKGTKASRVHLALQALKAPSGSQALLELMASRAPVANRASLGRKVTKDPEAFLGHLGQWGCRACQDLRVRRVRLGTWARWALPVPLALEDPLDLQALMGPKALQVE